MKQKSALFINRSSQNQFLWFTVFHCYNQPLTKPVSCIGRWRPTTCRKSVNKPSISCFCAAYPKLSTSLVVLLQGCPNNSDADLLKQDRHKVDNTRCLECCVLYDCYKSVRLVGTTL